MKYKIHHILNIPVVDDIVEFDILEGGILCGCWRVEYITAIPDECFLSWLEEIKDDITE